MVQSFRPSHKAANVVAGDQSAGETPCPGVAVEVSAKTLRNSVEDASTLKPSCRRDSRVCKTQSRAETVKRDHRNVAPSSSSHNICLKKVRDELPIGPVARNIADGSLEDRRECRSRAV